MIDLAKDEIRKVHSENRKALPYTKSEENKEPTSSVETQCNKSLNDLCAKETEYNPNTESASNACIENIEQKGNKTKDGTLTLDLMKYNYTDSQLILALFDNGTIGIGDKLIKKSLVLAELEEQGVKDDDYVTLLRRLKKQKLVTFDMGIILILPWVISLIRIWRK